MRPFSGCRKGGPCQSAGGLQSGEPASPPGLPDSKGQALRPSKQQLSAGHEGPGPGLKGHGILCSQGWGGVGGYHQQPAGPSQRSGKAMEPLNSADVSPVRLILPEPGAQTEVVYTGF